MGVKKVNNEFQRAIPTHKKEVKKQKESKDGKEKAKDKKETEKVKAEKEWSDLAKEAHVAEISKLDQELDYLEKKLGIKNNSKKKQSLKNKFKRDNFGEDMLDFLESIDMKVKMDVNKVAEVMKKKGKKLPQVNYEDSDEDQNNSEIEKHDKEEMEDEHDDDEIEEANKDELEQEQYNDDSEQESKEMDDDDIEEPEQENKELDKEHSEEESKEMEEESQEIEEDSDNNEESKSEEKKEQELSVDDIKKRFKGLFNRLSEGNIEVIFEQSVKLIKAISRSSKELREIQQILMDSYLLSAVLPIHPLSNLQPVYCAYMIGLSRILGESFLIATLKAVYKNFLNEAEEIENSSVRKNALYAMRCFYQLGAIKGELLLEILTELLKDPTPSNIDIMSHYAQNIGFDLRKEEPLKLKKFIEAAEEKLAELTIEDPVKKRMEYFVEILQGIKNNKKQALYDILKQKIKPFINWLKSNRLVSSINAGPVELDFQTLMDTKEKSLEAKVIERDVLKKLAREGDLKGEMALLEDIAIEQKMNTQIKKLIFTTIMTSIDHVDAFDKLIQLSLTSAQEREIIRVLVNCCGQEKYYNPFYASLGRKICEYKNDFRYTFKYVMWDHIKSLHRYTLRKINNLARFFADMMHTFALPIAILKALDFQAMSQYQIVFLNIVLEEVFKM